MPPKYDPDSDSLRLTTPITEVEAVYLAVYTGDTSWEVDELNQQTDQSWDVIKDSLTRKGVIDWDNNMRRKLSETEKETYRKSLRAHEQEIFKGTMGVELPSGRVVMSPENYDTKMPVEGDGDITPEPGDIIYADFTSGQIVERMEEGRHASRELTYKEDNVEYFNLSAGPDLRVSERRGIHPEIKVLAGANEDIPVEMPALFYDKHRGIQWEEMEQTIEQLHDRGVNPAEVSVSEKEKRAITNIMESRRPKHRTGTYSEGRVEVPVWNLAPSVKEGAKTINEEDRVIIGNAHSLSGPLTVEHNLDSEESFADGPMRIFN